MRATVDPQPPYAADLLRLVPARNLITGAKEIRSRFGALSTLEDDLLALAAAIYALDLAALRGEREHFIRDLELGIPVTNFQAFQAQKGLLTDILYFLSDDNWTLSFTRKAGNPEGERHWPTSPGKTLLFSGGLDSFAAAADELDRGNQIQLVSHYTGNPVIRHSQQALVQYLQATYGERVPAIAIRVGGRSSGGFEFPKDQQRENSQRTRSFVFLSLAAVVARRSGYHELMLMAENGQMAIHLPLTAARIGAFSTHTAHPQFVSEMQAFLTQLLSFRLVIKNPYLYKTKAEAIIGLVANHRNLIAESVSCWRTSRLAFSHCGECVPCLVRRIALERHGLSIAEYATDLFAADVTSLPPDNVGRRNLVELAEFVSWFRGNKNADARLLEVFPELVNEHINPAKAISMYRRFANEAETVLGRYPNVSPLLT